MSPQKGGISQGILPTKILSLGLFFIGWLDSGSRIAQIFDDFCWGFNENILGLFFGSSHLRPADSCFGEALRRGWMLVVTAIISFNVFAYQYNKATCIVFFKVILLYRSQKDWFTAKKMVFRCHFGDNGTTSTKSSARNCWTFFQGVSSTPDRCKNNPLKHVCLEACNFCLRRWATFDHIKSLPKTALPDHIHIVDEWNWYLYYICYICFIYVMCILYLLMVV